MRSCALERDINEEKRKKENTQQKEKKNINPSVVEMHVTVVTLEAMSTKRLGSKLGWKRQVM